MTTNICCGCFVEDDYGTADVSGSGSATDPYLVEQIDPLFNRPVARTTLQIDRTISINTPTAVQWTGVLFDSHEMFKLSDPTRLTVKVDGLYVMGFHIVWAGSGVGAYKLHDFRLNGATVLDSHTRVETGAFSQNHSGSYVWYFSAADYLELVLTSVTANTSILGTPESDSSGLGISSFWMMYLGKKV